MLDEKFTIAPEWWPERSDLEIYPSHQDAVLKATALIQKGSEAVEIWQRVAVVRPRVQAEMEHINGSRGKV